MPVAEMPRNPHQLGRAMGVDFKQRFGLGDNANDPAVCQFQSVAIPQPNRLRKVQQ